MIATQKQSEINLNTKMAELEKLNSNARQALIMATDAALTAGIVVLAEATRLAADLPLGQVLFLGIPPGAPAAGFLRYIGVRVTPAGGAATVTLSAALVPQSFVQAFMSYARGVTIL